jgi:hypothetical protein
MNIPVDEVNKMLFLELINGINDKWTPFHIPRARPSIKTPYVSIDIKRHSLKRLGEVRKKLNPDNLERKSTLRSFAIKYKALYGRTVPRIPMQQLGVMIQDTVEFCLQNTAHPDINRILAALPTAEAICRLFKLPAVCGADRSPVITQCTIESKKLKSIIDYSWVSNRTKPCINLFELKVSMNPLDMPSKIYNNCASFPTTEMIFNDVTNTTEFWVLLAMCQLAPGLRAVSSYLSATGIDATITAGVIYAVVGSAPKYFVVNNVTPEWISNLETLLSQP